MWGCRPRGDISPHRAELDQDGESDLSSGTGKTGRVTMQDGFRSDRRSRLRPSHTSDLHGSGRTWGAWFSVASCAFPGGTSEVLCLGREGRRLLGWGNTELRVRWFGHLQWHEVREQIYLQIQEIVLSLSSPCLMWMLDLGVLMEAQRHPLLYPHGEVRGLRLLIHRKGRQMVGTLWVNAEWNTWAEVKGTTDPENTKGFFF